MPDKPKGRQAGQPPRIEDYLAEMDPNGQAELLQQLLAPRGMVAYPMN